MCRYVRREVRNFHLCDHELETRRLIHSLSIATNCWLSSSVCLFFVCAYTHTLQIGRMPGASLSHTNIFFFSLLFDSIFFTFNIILRWVVSMWSRVVDFCSVSGTEVEFVLCFVFGVLLFLFLLLLLFFFYFLSFYRSSLSLSCALNNFLVEIKSGSRIQSAFRVFSLLCFRSFYILK